MPSESPSPPEQHRQEGPRPVDFNMYRMYRSAIAEGIIYSLILSASTGVVAFYFSIVFGSLGVISGLAKIRPFLETTLYAGLWALTARPSLALAGCVVRRRYKAYSVSLPDLNPYEAENMPVRWWFELFCFLANCNHYILPDPELYFRWVLYSLGAVGEEPSSLKLGTIVPQEREQLRVFVRRYREVSEESSKRWAEGYSGLWLPPMPISLYLIEAVHYLCAQVALSRRAQARLDAAKHSGRATILQGIANGRPAAKEKEEDIENDAPPSVSGVDRLYADCCFFFKLYALCLAYPLLRTVGDMLAAFGPLLGVPSSFEEWYDLYVQPGAETGSNAGFSDNSLQDCSPQA
ncbi:hypothetical protein CMUS01_11039 [Colletotrichum musicola]|uniref:Uncharacterized protein n=1 Tax=Colletotrichum musicola TaxID=2175873 RepID=A0A8H6JZY0_9PEZI|nr:hypothetical protein CMUS01_11039 [Colletotrichum musicola]